MLDIDKLAICQNQANRKFEKIKAKIEATKKQRSSWTSWLPGFGRKYKQQSDDYEDEVSGMDDQFEEVIEKYTEVIKKKEENKGNDEILFHFTVVMPLFEVFLCNKKTPSSPPQVFCRMRMNEINFQRSSSQNGRIDYLFAIDDIEVVNEQASIEKFETVFRKKPRITNMTEDESDEFLSRLNSDFDDDYDSSVDSDSGTSLFKNISKMKDLQSDPMQMLNSSSSPPLILLNLTLNKVASNQEEEEDISVFEIDFQNLEQYETSFKLYIQHFEVYIDKLMIGTIFNNFIKIQNDYDQILKSQKRFYISQEPGLNTSSSGLNLSLSRHESIHQMVSSSKTSKKSSLPYKSLILNISGISVFVPDTKGFEKESKVLMVNIGELKLTKGNPEIDRSRRLLDDEGDTKFEEILERNGKIVQTLLSKDSDREIEFGENFGEDQKIFELNEISVLMFPNLPPESAELPEDYKIIRNFDVKLIHDKSNMEDTEYKARIFIEMDRIELLVDKNQLLDTIGFTYTLQDDLEKLSGLFEESTTLETEPMLRNSSLAKLQVNDSTNRNWKDSSYQHDVYNTTIEENKLIDEEDSEDDDKFFDAFDASDRNVYSYIKNTKVSKESLKEDSQFKKASLNKDRESKDKLFLITESRGLALSIMHRGKKKQNTLVNGSRANQNEVYPIFKIQMNTFKIGMIQNHEAINIALNMHSFVVYHLENKILFSKIKNLDEDNEFYEDSRSNQSYSNNQSNNEEYIHVSEPQDNFLDFSFVLDKNSIIESNSSLTLSLGFLNFEISQK